MRGRQVQLARVKTLSAAGYFKKIVDLFRKNARTGHARPETRVIQFPAAQRADAVEDLFFSVREISEQPIFK